jgi:hypothetical protein
VRSNAAGLLLARAPLALLVRALVLAMLLVALAE